MRRRVVALALLLGAGPIYAQARGEQPVITLGITGGWYAGSTLWEVPDQPFSPPDAGGGTDTFDLARSITPGLTFGVTGYYFLNNHFGLTGEMALIGLGSKTTCVPTVPTGSFQSKDLCNSLAQSSSIGSSVGMVVGGVYRVASREDATPFLSVRAGIRFANTSPIQLEGTYLSSPNPPQKEFTKVIFYDPDNTRVEFYSQLALGFSFAAGPGYRVRLEIRDNYTRAPIPLGPSDKVTGAYSTGSVGKHIVSIVAGVDFVLEKKRGRRY
ncbi:MAG TPA: hypothetical protein VMJ30_01775 [Gemmatimonadales bacterium]|nr:hypothetical protein [Gemmatimonadales bacterium]